MEVGIDGDVLLYKSASAVEARGYIAYNDNNEPVYFSRYKKDVKEFENYQPWRCIEEDDFEHAISIFDAQVRNIVRATDATSYTIYLTGKDNFRHKLYSGYKASRKEKPLLYTVVRQHAEGLMDTVVVDGQEADDALAIAQYKDIENHIIASIDKDLLMVPGHHYNFNKEVTFTITPEEGIRHFYKQILTGDSIDDIPGIKGVGEKTAEKILAESETEEDMWYTVLNKWAEYLQHDSVYETVVRNAQLLWMRTKEDELWQPPM